MGQRHTHAVLNGLWIQWHRYADWFLRDALAPDLLAGLVLEGDLELVETAYQTSASIVSTRCVPRVSATWPCRLLPSFSLASKLRASVLVRGVLRRLARRDAAGKPGAYFAAPSGNRRSAMERRDPRRGLDAVRAVSPPAGANRSSVRFRATSEPAAELPVAHREVGPVSR
jgi:hypothetical protein